MVFGGSNVSTTESSHVGLVLGKVPIYPYVRFCSTLNSHLYLEGVRCTNIGPNPLYLWLLFLENWTGTLPKTESMCEGGK